MLLALILFGGCHQNRDKTGPDTPAAGSAPDQVQEWFSDRAAETGLNFVHVNGMSGEFYYPEIMAPGVGLLDFDDGDLDVYVVQGQMLGAGKTIARALIPPTGPFPLEGRLYRNDLTVRSDGTRTVRFTDVTETSGIQARGYGMGVAVGDVDNDGCADLYLTNLGPNQLFHNNCDGTFTDVSKQSRTDDPGWGVSASFLDFDRDGWLDLFVGNYVSYGVEKDIRCFMLAGGPNYCPPQVYRAQPSKLYHNNRDGTFSDVTAAAGMAAEFGPALGVATADFNGDGWIDVYVANDGQPNQLWINQRNGTFKNTALASGTALSDEGKAKSSMGIDAGDFDNDGDEDLFITELTGQGSDLYVNDGSGVFEEQSARAGIRFPTLPYTGFGTAWLDFDNDGWLDLLTVNGAVTRDPQRPKDLFSLQQRKQLLRNLGNGRFEEVTGRAGAVFQLAEVGRGAAFGDIDNDGDIDVVVGNDSGPVRLLINNVGNRNHWMGLRLAGMVTPRPSAGSAASRSGGTVVEPATKTEGTKMRRPDLVEGRDMLGARVGFVRDDGSTLWRRARSDGSYASANDPRVLVGLGRSAKVVRVQVVWPDGKTEEWTDVPANKYTTVKEGTGHAR